MILQALYRHAEEARLFEGMEARERLVHLVLTIEPDGSIATEAAWQELTHIDSRKKGTPKVEPGRLSFMPEFPGVNSGGKAYFLADTCDKVLGLNGKTGEPIGDDGGNAAKAFQHFWRRIADAHKATAHPDLAALLAFRDRYLATEEARRSLSIAKVVPFGKEGRPTFCALKPDGQPVPLDKKTIAFQVGRTSGFLFEKGSPLHDYWKDAFARERFADAPNSTGANLGLCLVTGEMGQPIAEVHRTLIKGVPGLPPIGGYVVSFDASTPSLSSYGFERGWNAPVSEQAAAAYALGLNDILANEDYRRRFGGAVLCSWVHSEPELSGEFNLLLDSPAEDDVKKFFDSFALHGRYHHALDTRHFHSLTLAANGGRVVVRRWLDEPLREAVGALKSWFDHLAIDSIEPPKKGEGGKGKSKARPGTVETDPVPSGPNPLSIYALAATTARVPSEVQSTVYDALYRAALDGPRPFNPVALLCPVLQRLRIAAAQSGGAIRFHTSRFALLKLILIRSEEYPMPDESQSPEIHDAAYNCGRLLALLDDIQYAAQGKVGADVVARFYGNASTFPRNVFQRLLRLEKHHRAKLLKNPVEKKRNAGRALARRIDATCALFQGNPPEFPGQLDPVQQGRFALGFHQEKARSERIKQEFYARKASGTPLTEDDAAAEVLSAPPTSDPE